MGQNISFLIKKAKCRDCFMKNYSVVANIHIHEHQELSHAKHITFNKP